MDIYKTFMFESAHRLPHVPAGHKCGRLHGHSYRLTVGLSGDVTAEGWVMDFAELSAAVKPLIEQLDHNYLNAIQGLENPTSEVLCSWVWTKLRPVLPLLTSVSVEETCTSRCVFFGG